MLFTVKPAVAVKLRVLDHDGTPTTGRFQFVDQQGHVFPPQAKRLAPDLFFQKHIYRARRRDGAAAARAAHDVLRPRAGVPLDASGR